MIPVSPRSRRLPVLALGVLLALGGASLEIAQAQQPAAGQLLAADAVTSTPSGVSFTAPAGWTLTPNATLIDLQAPEADTHLVFFETSEKDVSKAVAAAWAAYRPTATLAFKLLSPRPPRNGWEERQVVDYETSPNERLVRQAVALRSGATWTVLLIDGTEPTMEKRGAQVSVAVQSLRPKGFQRETFAGRTPNVMDAQRIEKLKEFVKASMQQLGIPGAAVALTQGNQVLFEGGFGVRELGKPAAVDANTLFMAASNTKGMATLLLAELVDDGKMRWDQPVTQVYPAFKLGDEAVTKQVRMEHLICACTGLPRQDMEWFLEFKNATPASSLALLGTMKPTSSFGEVFQYSNLMASAAGYIGGHLMYPNMELGAAFDKAMQVRIFDPLGMRSTTFDMARALRANHASPHATDFYGVPRVASMDSNYSIVPHRPAGGVWTSAHDLLRYAQLELSQGVLPDGKRLVSAENLLARRKAGIASGESRMYGMGLETDRTWGVPVVLHGGSMGGFKSNFYVLPDANIGAVLLTNSDEGNRLLRPFMRKLLELVYDGKPEAESDLSATVARMKVIRAKELERMQMKPTAADVKLLARRYQSPELGSLVVRQSRGDTIFDFGEWHSEVASRRNDDKTLSFITTAPTVEGMEFVEGKRDGKRVLVIRDGQHEYLFTER